MTDLKALFDKATELDLRIGNLFEKRSGEWNCFFWRRNAGEIDPPFIGVGKTVEDAMHAAFAKVLLQEAPNGGNAAAAPAAEAIPATPEPGTPSKAKKRLLNDMDDIL
jgi:hypothetical protein